MREFHAGAPHGSSPLIWERGGFEISKRRSALPEFLRALWLEMFDALTIIGLRIKAMNLSILKWKCSTAWSSLVASTIALAVVASAARAVSEPASSLDDYLKRVGYLPVMLKRGEQDELLAEGVLAGKKRLFLVDTGCERTVLNEATARGLKSLGELGVTLEDSFLGKLTNPSVVLMDKLTLGRAQFLNQPANVMNLRIDFISTGFDGVLGCDFFSRNYCLIDCFSRRLYVRGSKPWIDVTSAIEATLRGSGLTGVPIYLKYRLTVGAKVNAEMVKLVVDTGSTFNVLDTALAKRLGLTAAKHDEATLGSLMKKEMSTKVVGVGKIGAHKAWFATLKTLEVSSLQWTNVLVGVADLKYWGLAEPGSQSEEVQGVLGCEMLTTRGALIDYHSRLLWFRPQK
jgi:predicted aspartyl protease